MSKKHGREREWIDKAGPNGELVWDALKRSCDALGDIKGPNELQKSLATPREPGDNFVPATLVNSCSAYQSID